MIEKYRKLISAALTAIIFALIILLLVVCTITAHKDEQNEGVMMELGFADEGYGEQIEAEEPAVESAAPAVTTPKTPKPEEYITQEDPSVAIAREKKRQEEEQARIAEEKRKIDAENEAKKAAAAAVMKKGLTNTGNGSGSTTGDSQKGNPAGVSGGTGPTLSGNLQGRNDGTLCKPGCKVQQAGKITVQVRIDTNGQVTSAIIVPPSDIIDTDMRNDVIKTAQKTKFKPGPVAIGTITYTFENI